MQEMLALCRMSNARCTPDHQISQRSASFSIASQALHPATKGRTAVGFTRARLDDGRRLTQLQFLLSSTTRLQVSSPVKAKPLFPVRSHTFAYQFDRALALLAGS